MSGYKTHRFSQEPNDYEGPWPEEKTMMSTHRCTLCGAGWTTGHACPEAPRAAPQQAEPVAWVEVIDRDEGPYEFHGQKLLPRGKHSLYLHPPAAEMQTVPEVIRNADGNYVIKGSPPAGPLLDALLAQCELKAEVQRLRDAARGVCDRADAAQWALGNETGVPAAKLDALRDALKGGE